MNTNNNSISFGSACAVSEEMLYVASFLDCLDEETDHTRIFVLNLSLPGQWFHHDIDDRTVVSTTYAAASGSNARTAFALTLDGHVEIYNSNESMLEKIPRGECTEAMECIAYVDGALYACSSRHVYTRSDVAWQEIGADQEDVAWWPTSERIAQLESCNHQDVQLMTEASSTWTLLRCIDGTSGNNIYICGMNGIVLRWNGVHLSRSQCDTTEHLHDIHCLAPDDVLICGHNGTLIRGNHENGFVSLTLEEAHLNFWSVGRYRKTIYVGTTVGLFQVNGQSLTKVEPEGVSLPEHYSVACIDTIAETLWVVADKFVLRLKDEQWLFIAHPDNIYPER